MAKQNTKLAEVFHFDLYGKRDEKYDFLNVNSIASVEWNKLEPNKPNFFFTNKNFKGDFLYNKGISINDLFKIKAAGIKTHRDAVVIGFNEKELKGQIASYLLTLKNSNIIFNPLKCKSLTYRPFDNRLIYYDKELVVRHRQEQIKHSLLNNYSLIIGRQTKNKEINHFFISNTLSEMKTAESSTGSYHFQLYLYPETSSQQTIRQDSPPLEGAGEVRTPNLNAEIVKQIADKLGLTFTNEKTSPTPPKEGLSQPGYVTANPINYKLIKEMRDGLKDNPTEAEKVMWEYLRNKKTGYKIRRQHIIDDFITDFVCLSKKVVIEIDGKIHLLQKEYDELRTARLNELEYDVIRFTNEEVFANPQLVVSKIKEKLDGKSDLQSDEDAISPPLEGSGEVFAPIDILDYIYAVLHSPTYREKYKEFLKIDFPRVPYPKDKETFWQLVKLGGEIRQIHLLESSIVEKYITQYPIDGDNEVVKPRFDLTPTLSKGEGESPSFGGVGEVGKVYINDTQYFDNVPETAWNFYIGGYQPAQKWLKDRKERKLEFDDILHYQKIIVALSETDRLMKEIDKIDFV